MSQVNITLNTNTVDVNTTNNQIVVTDPTNPNVVNITQPVTSVVEVITAGPQGVPGPAGAIPNTGSFATTGSNTFIGNQTITGSLTVVQSSNTVLSTGTSILYRNGTASVDWRTRTLNNGDGNVVLDWENNQLYDILGSSSIDWEGRALYDPNDLLSVDYGTRRLRNSGNNLILNWETGDLTGTASYATQALSSSFAQTASFLGSTTNAFLQNGNSFGTTALLGTNDNQSLALETSGSTRMFISSSGNIGIGTLTPLASLHISGASSAALLRIDSPTASGSFFVSGSGNVGIGNINPTVPLEIGRSNGGTQAKLKLWSGATQFAQLEGGDAYFDFNTGGGYAAILSRNGGYKFTLPADSVFGWTSTVGGGSPVGVANTTLTRWSAGVVAVGSGSASNASGSLIATSIGLGTLTPSASLHISGASSANLLRIDSPASSSILFVSGSGNVGINTSTPAYTLDVNGTARVQNHFHQSSGFALISLGNTLNLRSNIVGGSGYIIDVQSYNTLNGTNNEQGFANFLGTYAPTSASGTPSFNALKVTPTINQTGGANGITRGLYVNPTLTAAADFRAIETTAGNVLIQRGSTPLLFVSQSGNVGIGTSSPSASLHISGASSANLLRIDSPASSNILFVSGSGRVGIGTITPRELLHVAGGNIALDGVRYIDFGSGNSRINDLGLIAGQGYPITISTFGPIGTGTATSLIEKLRLTGSGSLGLGTTSPSARFHISGGFTDGNLMRVQSPTGAEYFFISASGNVGIGTTTPTNTLDIQSTATGSLRISGSGGSQITLVRPTAGLTGFMRYVGSTMELGTAGSDPLNIFTSNTARLSVGTTGNIGIGIGAATPSARLQVQGSGATNSTTTFLLTNSTPTNLLTINDIGQVSFTSPTMSLAVSQSAFSISPIISASAVVGGQYYGVNITPTFFQTTGSQTETAFRVAATFTSSNATATGGTNIIADFGSTSAGSQLTVTDVTSGSIYMVNDVSGLPIIEATSDWGVKIYDFPRVVLEKTGSQVNINGTLQVSGSFILPLSQSATPQTGSAYWSGSLLFIYNGTRYMSASFF
jgi:hypothetical protein